MGGIKFVKELKAVWYDGSDPIFNDSEIGQIDKETRKLCCFKIKPLSEKEVADLRKECHNKDGEWDGAKFSKELINAGLRDWEGVLDEEQMAIPCTAEKKMEIIDLFPRLAVAITVCIRTAGAKQMEEENARKKVIAGNLSSTAAGLQEGKKI